MDNTIKLNNILIACYQFSLKSIVFGNIIGNNSFTKTKKGCLGEKQPFDVFTLNLLNDQLTDMAYFLIAYSDKINAFWHIGQIKCGIYIA